MTIRSTCAWRVCMLRGSRGCPNAVAKRRWIRNEGVEGTWEVCRRNRKDSWLARKTTKSWNEWIEKTERQREDQGGLFSWKKWKEEEKKASSSRKVQILCSVSSFFFFFLCLSPSQVQVGSRGLVFRVDWTKKKGKKALDIFRRRAEPTRVVVHPNTAQPDKKKERLQPAVMDIGTPSSHPISICSLSSPYWLVPWLAHDDDRETWKVKEKNNEIMKIIIIIIINKILWNAGKIHFERITFSPHQKKGFSSRKKEIHGPVGDNKDYLYPKITRVMDKIENGEKRKKGKASRKSGSTNSWRSFDSNVEMRKLTVKESLSTKIFFHLQQPVRLVQVELRQQSNDTVKALLTVSRNRPVCCVDRERKWGGGDEGEDNEGEDVDPVRQKKLARGHTREEAMPVL